MVTASHPTPTMATENPRPKRNPETTLAIGPRRASRTTARSLSSVVVMTCRYVVTLHEFSPAATCDHSIRAAAAADPRDRSLFGPPLPRPAGHHKSATAPLH